MITFLYLLFIFFVLLFFIRSTKFIEDMVKYYKICKLEEEYNADRKKLRV